MEPLIRLSAGPGRAGVGRWPHRGRPGFPCFPSPAPGSAEERSRPPQSRGGAVQGTLIMIPLAALVAVAQAATNGEGHGDLVRHLQHDALGQVGVVVVQNDGFHSCLHFDIGRLTGRQIEMEERRGAASGGAAPHSLWPRWPEVTGNDNARTALYCAGA